MVGLFAGLLAAVTLGTVALVLAPLWRRPAAALDGLPHPGFPDLDGRDGLDPAAADLRARYGAALQTIRELDFDYRLGNLPEADYRELRERHKREAIAILATMDSPWGLEARGRGPRAVDTVSSVPTTVDDALDAAIERAVLALRQQRWLAGVGAVRTRSGGDGVAASLTPLPRLQQHWRRGGGGHSAVRISALAGRRADRWLVGGALAALAVVGGVTWLYLSARSAQQDQRPLAQLPPQVQEVRALAFLPGRAGAVLLGYGGGLLVSEDGGRSWRPLDVAGTARVLIVHPARPAVVYTAGQDLFLKSEDGGQSWAPLRYDLPGSDVQALAGAPDDPNVLYAVVAGHRLFRSEDGGAHWALVAAQLPAGVTGLAVWSGGDRALYLATAGQGVFSSVDGRGWGSASGVVTGALPTLRTTALAYDPRSGDRYVSPSGIQLSGALYAGTDRGLFKSIDGGLSWRRLPLQADVAALAVDPANSQVLLVVDSRGRVFQSTDRGVTWRGER